MSARDELQHIIWRYDLWRNIHQHELRHNIYHHNIYHHNIYVHAYDDVYVHHDGCSRACAYDVYLVHYGDIYVDDGVNNVDDGVNNDSRRNDDDKLFV